MAILKYCLALCEKGFTSVVSLLYIIKNLKRVHKVLFLTNL